MRSTLLTALAFAAVVTGFAGVADTLMPADPAPVVLDTSDRDTDPGALAGVAAYDAARLAR